MSLQLSNTLFSNLSSETASQTNGGYWAHGHHHHHHSATTVVRVRFSPGIPYAGNTTINLTNPEIDDGSIVNFSTGGVPNVNITNPDIDDGSILEM